MLLLVVALLSDLVVCFDVDVGGGGNSVDGIAVGCAGVDPGTMGGGGGERGLVGL